MLSPDYYFVRVTDIEPGFLEKQGYRAVLLDVDNTILPRNQRDLSPDVRSWVEALAEAGFKIGIISNTNKERVYRIANELQVVLVPNAYKPFTRAYVEACASLGVACSDAVMIGDQCYTDVLGAHLVGMDAIMVMPQCTEDPWHTYLLRCIDALAVRRMRPIGGTV